MPLSEETIARAWELARGRCECTRDAHGHDGRCRAALVWERRGLIGEGGWFAREWTPVNGGEDEPGNCEILCVVCSRALHGEEDDERHQA
jgi:hypothetical protein